ncbi:helix-turn-helix transcriptional regulator [Streptomyces sp. NPDC052496]|uniref:helix-turn-helix domain-containing protein n=1 Tax=Streptomyces sp. NPDC052496 TaxID=3154951 RepID=UPI0034201901
MARRRGRPLAPIKAPDRRVGQLAGALRQARLRVGLSRAELAVKVKRSVTTIHRAEAGRVRVPWPVTRDIAMACHLDLDTVERAWRQAGRPGRTRLTEAPHVTLLRTPADLAAALRRAWEKNGEPSLRMMEARAERRAKEYSPLSRTSAWRIRERKQAVSSLKQLYAYLIACEVAEADFPVWAQAWTRVRHHEAPVSRRGASPASLARRHLVRTGATAMMLEAGLVALEPYPGFLEPWSARCQGCGAVSRFRLSNVKAGLGCRICRRPRGAGVARAG